MFVLAGMEYRAILGPLTFTGSEQHILKMLFMQNTNQYNHFTAVDNIYSICCCFDCDLSVHRVPGKLIDLL